MKTLQKLVVAITLVLATTTLSGCGSSPQPVPDPVREHGVTLLFENDGVKVYRFSDYGSDYYYSDARGAVSWRRRVGKVTHRHSIPTTE